MESTSSMQVSEEASSEYDVEFLLQRKKTKYANSVELYLQEDPASSFKDFVAKSVPIENDEQSDEDSVEDIRDASLQSNKARKEFQFEEKDWNTLFQKVWQEWYQSKESKENRQPIIDKISEISFQFREFVKPIAKILLEEIPLKDEEKTFISTVEEKNKFVIGNVYFEIIVDEFRIFGSPQLAMKGAAQELKTITTLMHLALDDKISHIHFPLTTLFDFNGHRILAQACLPINATTLVYGSGDGGINIHSSDEKAKEIMQRCAQHLNLKEHIVMNVTGEKKEKLWTNGDIECHKGTDNLYYVLDTQRLMPPMKPREEIKKRGAFLCRLFRPEFMMSYKKALSSDGFCSWGRSGDSKVDDANRADLIDASKYFEETVIPNLAKKLDQRYGDAKEVDMNEFVSFVHRHGVNVRYLGFLRKFTEKKNVDKLLLEESIARLLKNIIRNQLRNERHNPEIRSSIVEFFNFIFQKKDNESKEFWKNKIPNGLLLRFVNPLLSDEKVGFDFSLQINRISLFQRIQQVTGIIWKEDVTQKIQGGVELQDSDLEEVRLIFKDNPLSLIYEGSVQLEDTLNRCSVITKKVKKLKQTCCIFSEALCRYPQSISALNNLGVTFHSLANAVGNFEIINPRDAYDNPMKEKSNFFYYEKSCSYFQDAESIKKNRETTRLWAKVLFSMAMSKDDTERTSLFTASYQKFDAIDEKAGKEDVKSAKKNTRKIGDFPIIKLLIIGDIDVGKTSLLIRYAYDDFSDEIAATIGTDPRGVLAEINGNTYSVSLWDTGGYEAFREITASVFRGIHGVIIVYDVTKPDTFEHIKSWRDLALRYTQGKCRVAVVGNKIDERDAPRQVEKDEALQSLASISNDIDYFETSALHGDGVEELFCSFISSVITDKPKPPPEDDIDNSQKKDEKKDHTEDTGFKCCTISQF